MPTIQDPTVGPVPIGTFTALPGVATTSPSFHVNSNAHAVRVTWKELPGGFGVFPTNVTVTNGDGSVTWCNYDIGFSALTNIKSSDILVPINPQVDNTIVVTVSEIPQESHVVYVSEVCSVSYTGTIILGAQVVVSSAIRQIGTNMALTTFGELAVGGREARPSRPPRPRMP